jgi:hypothetical protein
MAYCRDLVQESELWNIEGAWRELFAYSSYPTPFASWEWAMQWWRHFSVCSTLYAPRLLTLAVHATDDELIGIAPFYYSADREAPLRLQDLRLLGDLGGREEALTEEPILLLRRGREREALNAILCHLRRHSLGGNWDYVNLRVVEWDAEQVPFENLTATPLQRRQTIPLQTLALPPSWEELHGSFRKSMRDNLAYYPRLLRRRGHTSVVHFARKPEEVARAIAIVVDLHHRRAASTRGIPHTNHLVGVAQQRFLAEVLPLLAGRGMASVLLLKIDGEIVAAQSVLESAGMLTVYYSGFDPRWYDYSPLTLLCAEAIRDAIRRGLSMINFLPVVADYKSRWGVKPGRDLHELVYLQPRPLSLVRALLHGNGPSPRP